MTVSSRGPQPAPAPPAAAAGGDLPGGEFRLDSITGPNPDSPAAIIWLSVDGIAAAIAAARRILAGHDGPGDAYGELYVRHGQRADFLTTIHVGA